MRQFAQSFFFVDMQYDQCHAQDYKLLRSIEKNSIAFSGKMCSSVIRQFSPILLPIGVVRLHRKF